MRLESGLFVALAEAVAVGLGAAVVGSFVGVVAAAEGVVFALSEDDPQAARNAMAAPAPAAERIVRRVRFTWLSLMGTQRASLDNGSPALSAISSTHDLNRIRAGFVDV